VILAAAKTVQELMPGWSTAEVLAACIILCGISLGVYSGLVAKLRDDGGRVRHDLFALSDLLAALVIAGMFGLTFLATHIVPAGKGPAPAMKPGDVIQGALAIGLFAVPGIVLLIARNVNLVDAFGLRRFPVWRTLPVGAGLVAAFLPVFLFVAWLSVQVLGEKAQAQELVSVFSAAAEKDQRDMIWRIALSAVIIAPFFEELIFRGYLYPAFKRFFGPFPAAVGTALLFAMIHDNAAGFAGLALLALAFTLAYEWSGSILLPIVMHACFNAMNLGWLWWITTQLPKP
jgi:membrane protease YdiL (CAAX protease family)